MPFCIGCGVRVEQGVQTCPACEARTAHRTVCPRCGAPSAAQMSRFCIGCGSPLASGAAPAVTPPPAANPPAPAKPAPPAAAHAAAPPPKTVDLVQSARSERAAVYQRLGRQLIGACYEGRVRYDALPDEIARQTKAGIESIRKGHAALARAGVCPRCLEASLGGTPLTCSRCRLIVPPAKDA